MENPKAAMFMVTNFWHDDFDTYRLALFRRLADYAIPFEYNPLLPHGFEIRIENNDLFPAVQLELESIRQSFFDSDPGQ